MSRANTIEAAKEVIAVYPLDAYAPDHDWEPEHYMNRRERAIWEILWFIHNMTGERSNWLQHRIDNLCARAMERGQ